MDNNLYVFNGRFFNQKDRDSYMYLLKVLFRLEVIDDNVLMELVMEFRPFFV